MSTTIKTSLTPIKGDYRRETERIMSLSKQLETHFGANNPYCIPFISQMGINAFDAACKDPTKFDGIKKDYPDENDRLLLQQSHFDSLLMSAEDRLKNLLAANKAEEAQEMVKYVQALKKDADECNAKLKAAGKLGEAEKMRDWSMELMASFCFG